MEELMAILNSYDLLYYEWAKKSGMPETAFYIMMEVWLHDGECTQADVCAQWSKSRQTVNSALKSLEKKGYLELRSQEAGNKKTILFTDKGRQYADDWVAPIIHLDEGTWMSLPEEERATCVNVLKKQFGLLRDAVGKIRK